MTAYGFGGWKTVPPMEILHAVSGSLRQEFPEATLTEARVEFRIGERHDNGDPSEEWSVLSWTVQVSSDHGSGGSPEEAIEHIRKKRAISLQTPKYAERIANVLREIPDEPFARSNAIEAAQRLLNKT